MASVWDTLNKMKARQKAAAETAKSHRKTDTSRKEAVALFERQFLSAVEAGEVDGSAVLRKMRDTMDADENVRAVIDGHKERMKGDVGKEIVEVRRMIEDVRAELGVAGLGIRKANDVSKKLKYAF